MEPIKDSLYDIFVNCPTRENLRALLQKHTGEEDYLDFKEDWLDKEKEARHILAMANSGGGCIIFGVHQEDDGSFLPVGLNTLKDTAELSREVKKFLPPSLKYAVSDFKFESSEYEKLVGKKFQILVVEDKPLGLPFICCADGKNLKDGDIFIRKGTESHRANNYDIDNLIKRKLKFAKTPRTNNLALKEHLEQLKTLYSELTYTTSEGGILQALLALSSALPKTKTTTHKKDCYPKEDFDAFVVRMLDRKKKRIEEELDI